MADLTKEDYQFRMAACVLATLNIGIPKDRYVNLKELVERADLEGAIKEIDNRDVTAVAASIRKAVAGAGDWQVKQIANGDSKALIFTCGDEAQISFPGTAPKDIKMLLTDADALSKRFTTGSGTKCWVDRGFALWNAKTKDAIEAELDNLECRDISINGYSLGAGVAMLFALGLKDGLKSKVKTVCTFASPHIGGRLFAKAVERELADDEQAAGKVHNVRNEEDPITCVPPWFRKSPGGNVSIDGNGEYPDTNNPFAGKSRREIRKIWKEVRREIECFNIEHHFPSAYFKGLEKLAEKPDPDYILTSARAIPLFDRLAHGRQ